jgi:hypothetical protein
MAQITNGKFHYLRVIKDDDFGIKREFAAELSFAVGENESPDEIMGFVAQKVVDIAHEKLRIRSGSAAAEVQARPGSPSPASPPPAADPVLPKNDKEKLAAAAGLTQAAPPVAAPVKPKKAPKIAPAPEAAVEDDLSELFGETEPAKPARVVTDKEIIDAVNKKNGILKDPPKLVALKEEFVGKLPKQLRDIPAERREEFLKRLEDLK